MAIKKILIANRGEIALRIIRACKEMDIQSVAIFSEVDIDGLWIRQADECYVIVGNPVEAYLNYDRIISLAKKAQCDAIHPGYGFLSESAQFAQACADNGIIFIGPRPDHIALFGDKMASKNAMIGVNVPVIEGTNTPIVKSQDGIEIAKNIGFPVIIKAAFGGGGRGMRIVHSAENFTDLFEAATSESKKFFGRGEVFIEKYVEQPRHIEVQIMADRHGNVVHLGERDCSIQRRHQKVIEIAPSPRLNDATRQKIFELSIHAMKALGYESVGTMEYLIDAQDNIYFIEMNTRVQVEHPVTEYISGVDIIKQMICIAQDEKLPFSQEDISLRGYAIEFRINAEDPQKGFFPSSGTISHYIIPGGAHVRIDSALYTGYAVPANYDSMIGKLIVWGETYEQAVKKAKRALDELYIDGLTTNVTLHREVVRDAQFQEGEINTSYLDNKLKDFNLSAGHHQHEQEARVKSIAQLIASIKKHNITVKY